MTKQTNEVHRKIDHLEAIVEDLHSKCICKDRVNLQCKHVTRACNGDINFYIHVEANYTNQDKEDFVIDYLVNQKQTEHSESKDAAEKKMVTSPRSSSRSSSTSSNEGSWTPIRRFSEEDSNGQNSSISEVSAEDIGGDANIEIEDINREDKKRSLGDSSEDMFEDKDKNIDNLMKDLYAEFQVSEENEKKSLREWFR